MALPFFPFYVRDWLASSNVSALTYAQKGVYVELLARMWEHSEGRDECSLPADDAYLARLLKVSPREWKALRTVLIDAHESVFHIAGSRLYNTRLSREWNEANERSSRHSANGKMGASKRWHSQAIAEPSPSHGEAIASHMHTTQDTEDKGQRERESASAASLPSLTPDDVLDLWNETCPPALPEARVLSDERRRKAKTRLARPGRDAEWWRTYFARIRRSPFCCGDNDRGWRADFGWAIHSEENVAKVLEGKYDARALQPVQARASPPSEPAGFASVRAVAEKMRAREVGT